MTSQPNAPLHDLNVPTANLIYRFLNPGDIYIASLIKGAEDDPLSCVLDRVALDDAGDYEALSYTWGESTDLQPITMNGRIFYITQNLFAALKHLRLPTSDRRLWVDALCINQLDIVQRNNQVRNMHSIYSAAKQVLAWIGTENDGDFVIEILSGIESREIDPSFITIDTISPDWFWYLGSFYFREYWHRLWVIQEVTFAKQVQVLCGHHAFSYGNVIKLFETVASVVLSSPKSDHEQVYRITNFFLDSRPDKTFALDEEGSFDASDLLRAINLKNCKDPRDRIFGIHSILPADLRNRIPIDYSATPADVFVSATRAFIERDGHIYMITWRTCDHGSAAIYSSVPLPSWAIDWAAEGHQVPFSDSAKFNAAGDTTSEFRFIGNLLEIRGVRIGILRQVWPRIWGRDEASSLRFTAFVEQSRKCLNNVIQERLADEETCVLTCLGGFPEVAQDADTPFITSFVRAGLFDKNDELELSTDWSIGNLLKYLRGRAFFTFNSLVSGTDLEQTCEKRNPPNNIGLGSDGIRPGDVACICPGFKAPLILRPCGQYYKLICDAYVRRFMHGELLENSRAGSSSPETFILS